MCFYTCVLCVHNCGVSFSVEHALSCAKGGFPSIRDLIATLLTDVCNDVCVEPDLQPLTDEVLRGTAANTQTGTQLAANSFWGGSFKRITYFDVRIFNPHVRSNKHPDPQAVYRKHERIKKRAYEQRMHA